MCSIEDAIKIIEKAINSIPMETGWTFSKLWSLLAKALIRSGNLTRARKILGIAIGKHPKRSLFASYISIEKKLREFDRVRKLYERWLLWCPNSQEAWLEWSSLERALGDTDRAKSLLLIGIDSCNLPIPLISEAISLCSDSGEEILILLEKWISISPLDTEPWLRLCAINPTYWDKALSHFEEFENVPLASLVLIIDGYIANEEAAKKPTEWLQTRRPIFDSQSETWLRSSITETDQAQTTQPQEQETSAALRLLEVARKWRKGETIYDNDYAGDNDTGDNEESSAEKPEITCSKRSLPTYSDEDKDDLDY